MLLRPDPRTTELILGVVGRAQSRTGMRIVCFCFLSNHCHFALRPTSARQLAQFMGYVLSNVAREVGRLHGWRDKFWARRYSAIVVSDEEAAQVGRLRYLLGQGVKEGLVASPQDWPGPHCVDAMLKGTTLQGTWYDRTAEYRARQMGLDVCERDFASQETLVLTALPCWEDAPETIRRDRVQDLIDEVVKANREERGGRAPLGRAAILRQHPHELPAHRERRYAPAFHAATRAARLFLVAAYRRFVTAFRRAADRLRAGQLDARFPADSFPPALPYVAVSEGSG